MSSPYKKPNPVTESSPSSPDWTRLPGEILSIISSFLPTLSDYISFRSVCRSYRSAPPRRSLFPLLIYPSPCRIEPDGSHTISFFNPLTSAVGFVDLPEARCTLFCGSADGFLFLRSSGTRPPFRISFLNPVTRSHILLPWLIEPPEKIILTSLSPLSAVAIYDFADLCYWSQGWKAWKRADEDVWYQDVLPYKGRLYVVDDRGTVFVFASLVPDSPPVQLLTVQFTHELKDDDELKCYLVEFDGDLLLVIRYLSLMERPVEESRPIYRTTWFEVFKLEDLDGIPRWSTVESLGDGILFLGVNRSFSISARDAFSATAGIAADVIYFCDDVPNTLGEVAEREKDFGFFRVKEGLLNHSMPYATIPYPLLPPAIYFTPRL